MPDAPFGMTSGRQAIRSLFQPTLVELGSMMEYVRERHGGAPKIAPIPARWSFSQPKKQLQLSIHADDLPRCNLCYGFIGHIADAPAMEDTCTPLHLQVVVKLAYRFGETARGDADSFALVRVNAFSSKAALGRSFESLALGAAVKGILDLTKGSCDSALLVGLHPPLATPAIHMSPFSY